jgi:hypothetical protein
MVLGFIGPPVESSHAAQLDSVAHPVPAPNWLAWKVFHDSFAFYARQSGVQVEEMLASRFDLTPAEATALLAAGRTFVGAIQRIDTDAKAQADTRYGRLVRPARPPNAAGARIRWSGPRPRGPEKTRRERAIEDGLYAAVEARKEAALTEHTAALAGQLDAVKFARVAEWVNTSVAPQITTFTQPPARDRRASSGARGSVPLRDPRQK